ncbi:MAG TPA: SURF1 family protein [Gemmatimonadaceae bacterium]|nr:SURF1 family protein [Gemmatimonadaceae bacterium]
MKGREIAFVACGSILAALFVSLGFWQLSRLAERRAMNEHLRARARTAPVSVSALPRDTGAAHFRRVKISGLYDFTREFVITNRSRNGSPGVNIITPVRVAGSDTAVLVNRGWVYAPDGMTVDLSKWREPDSMSSDGFVENFTIRKGSAQSANRPNVFRWMDRNAITRGFPHPLAGFVVVLIDDGKPQARDIPPRLTVPPLDEGSHLNYAFQWFSFATISIFGMFLFVRRK